VETESLVNCIDGMFVHEKSRLDVLVSLTGTRSRDFGIVFNLFFVRCARTLLCVCSCTLTTNFISSLFVMSLLLSSSSSRIDVRTTVKLRVAFEQATEETEETSAKVLASLGKIEEILRARSKEATTDELRSIERLLMEAELCQMLDRKREELEEREREVAMEEERHREGVKAVLELKNKLKKEAVVAENNSGDARRKGGDDDDDMKLGDVVEEKDVLKAVSKKKEKSLDDFLNEEEEEENNDDESASTAKTKYGEAARLKFEKQKKELLEKQRLAYEKAFRKR